MHIPDGYLSPATAAVMYAAAAPFWYRATQKIKSFVTGRMVPLIALFAALSFVIMMFNVPLPDTQSVRCWPPSSSVRGRRASPCRSP
jgi:cobalt/nickel transport system permease protein